MSLSTLRATTVGKCVGDIAPTPSGVDWSDELRTELLSVDFASSYGTGRCVFQGREVRFVFITGLGKSGTNWLGNVLNADPRVYVDPAEHHYQILFHEGFNRLSSPTWQAAHREPYKSAARLGLSTTVQICLLSGIANKPDVRVVVDRSPRWIQELVPGALTIHLVRDPRDVLVSHTHHHLRLAHDANLDEWQPETASLIRDRREEYLAEDVEGGPSRVVAALCERRDWCDHFFSRWGRQTKFDLGELEKLGPRGTLVRYEDLHDNVTGVQARLLGFVGLDADEHKNGSDEPTELVKAGRDRERRAFIRKGQPGDWENYESQAMAASVERFCADPMRRLGYGFDPSAGVP